MYSLVQTIYSFLIVKTKKTENINSLSLSNNDNRMKYSKKGVIYTYNISVEEGAARYFT